MGYITKNRSMKHPLVPVPGSTLAFQNLSFNPRHISSSPKLFPLPVLHFPHLVLKVEGAGIGCTNHRLLQRRLTEAGIGTLFSTQTLGIWGLLLVVKRVGQVRSGPSKVPWCFLPGAVLRRLVEGVCGRPPRTDKSCAQSLKETASHFPIYLL